jgi:hypothetical protein
MASTYLTRTPTSNGSSTTWTYSVWVKRSANLSADQRILSNGNQEGSGSQDTGIIFLSNDAIRFDIYDNGTTRGNIDTIRKFRDTNAWYHFVFVWNTTSATSTMNGSSTDRMQIWVNGVQETELTGHTSSAPTIPSQNASDPNTNSTSYAMRIGTRATNQYFNGLISHAHFIDGTAYDASAFGEFDANGVWKIKTSPSVTYGTNGFFILKDGNSVTDQSGNGNNCTVGGGTLTNTEDNPSNVFATFNALAYFGKGSALENGNTRAYGDSATSNNECSFTTLTGSSGKYYAEFKIAFVGDGSFIGISDIEYTILENNDGQYRPFTIMVRSNGTLNVRGSGYGAPTTTGSWSSSYTTNDILQVAMDLDNNYFYFGKNGTWQNSGVPSSGATGTGGVAITSDKNYAFTFGGYGSSPSAYANFGNGYFGTTAVASAGTNASGNGIFEYDVPTGYTALSTKGLNE